jgi:hypothetical protein
MPLVEVDVFTDGWAAQMARARLAAEGIEAVLFEITTS